MKKPSSKIREEIAKLQEQLKQAETREAERIGGWRSRRASARSRSTIPSWSPAFEEVATRFRKGIGRPGPAAPAPVPPGAPAGSGGEA